MMCLLLVAFNGYTQPYFKIESNYKRVKIPFKIIRNMVVIPLFINQKGPYNFILDTGAGLIVITDPCLIDSLNIKYKREIKIAGLGDGEDHDAYVVPFLNFKINAVHGDNMVAAVFKNDLFNLSAYAGIPIHGLLGYEFFNSFSVKINFTDSTLTVGNAKDIRVERKSTKIPLSIENHEPYLYAKVKLTDGAQLNPKLIVDLGAGHPLLLENMAAPGNTGAQKLVSANLGVGLNGPISGYLSRVSELDLGKYKLSNIITSFPDNDTTNQTYEIKHNGNLGFNILKRFNMVIDYQNNALYIKPNIHFKEPYEHDMSGMEYYAGGPDLKRIIINRVEQNSPADEVGIETGDEILAINFKPTSKMTVEEIDSIFQSREDRSLLIEIARHDKRDRVILKLKKRI